MSTENFIKYAGEALDYAAPLITATAGAYFGAWSAFKFQGKRHDEQKKDAQHEALYRAHYALFLQHNFIRNVLNNHLREYKDDPMRFVKIPMFIEANTEERVQFGEITFTAIEGDPNFLQKIALSQASYDNVAKFIGIRNEKYQELHDSAGPERSVIIDPENGGVRLNASDIAIYRLKNATDVLFDLAEGADKRYISVIEEARATSKEIFPDKPAMSFTPMVFDPEDPPKTPET